MLTGIAYVTGILYLLWYIYIISVGNNLRTWGSIFDMFVESKEAIEESCECDTSYDIFSLFFLPISHHRKFIL